MMIVTATNARAYSLLPIVMVTVGTNYPQSPIYRPEGAAYHHIFFVEKGDGVLETTGKRFLLTEGTAVFMRRDVPVGYYGTGAEFKTAWITFVGDGVDGVLDYLGAEDFAFLKSDSIYPMIVNAYKLAEHNAEGRAKILAAGSCKAFCGRKLCENAVGIRYCRGSRSVGIPGLSPFWRGRGNDTVGLY